MTHHAAMNESIRLGVTTEASAESKIAIATFCRRNGFPQLYFEVLEPLLRGKDLILAHATTERPWPPKGIGSQTVEALGIAMIGSEGRAQLTPVLVDRKHATNLGLVAGITKQLLEFLRERKAASAGYLVRQGEHALERALEQAGFGKADLLAATEHAEYSEYCATPQKILEAFGLERARLGDVLALALDGRHVDRLSSYHFALSAGFAPYLLDAMEFAALLPGLLDFVATLPPTGVPPGTPGPQGPDIGPGLV
jgi:hypothetical protein